MAKITDDNDAKDLKPDTRLVVAGRNSAENHGFVNPPVIHASTVLYPNAADLVAHRARYQYDRRGTPTSEALEDALRAIEGPGCTATAWSPGGPALRFHIGLEDKGDLIADLERGFSALSRAL